MATTTEATVGRSTPPRPGSLEPAQAALAALLGLEILVFAAIGTNFFTVGNGFEVLRLSVEIGLLAVALTPVIVSGGIDLSVGSLMGLAAVVFGMLWRDAGLPIPLAAALAIGLGALAGSLNGILITRLRIPPLIVTLGTYSLFRGLAEGMTGGVDNFTDFPAPFLFLGQGYVSGVLPTQVPIFAAVALGFWVLLHRSTIGRGLVAVGYSPEGARHAGLRVDRLVWLVYVLSGAASGLAAVVYVSHLGQAKADAGLGYELLAITAVVLGGTSIFGGRGSVVGTLLGLFTIAVLQNGMRLADLPAELSGVLTGVLLLVAIGLDRRPGRATAPHPRDRSQDEHEGEWTVKNSQVAVICAVILAAGAIIAASNVYMVRTIADRLVGAGAGGNSAPVADRGGDPADRPITVAMMPKSKGNAYFIACRQGAEEAARELGVNLIWDGPTDPDPARQNQIIDTWITRGVDVIAVAVENRDGIASVLKKAQDRGIKVITWDADAATDARTFFVNQATPEGIGRALMDTAAEIMGGEGEFAIITASLTAANMISWQEQIELRREEAYPDIEMAVLRPCDDLQQKAYDEANNIMNAHPDVELIMAICTPAVPGAAEAVKQSGRDDVKVIGLGLPNDNKRYVHDGITEAVILWNSMDLGYLTVHAAKALEDGTLEAGDERFDAGRLGTVDIRGDNILLGEPFTFTEENIDQFDF
ncbi:substrate-binding domain-containing protein [Tautonia plasticadhaerens]|uniref:Autoinducer 2 import system permease protein LsrD n=1 Tax=Tautonia plasticadhaerens TaxID=2527974 RepID=A0A518H4W9_9BACT|nr:substrate-binding domain-containing protein [Tautonia plasticadhaerens]QDV35883.1 Autoinducer 2 import system permease protein LsrD [Tautonia plasticadhaerens]